MVFPLSSRFTRATEERRNAGERGGEVRISKDKVAPSQEEGGRPCSDTKRGWGKRDKFAAHEQPWEYKAKRALTGLSSGLQLVRRLLLGAKSSERPISIEMLSAGSDQELTGPDFSLDVSLDLRYTSRELDFEAAVDSCPDGKFWGKSNYAGSRPEITTGRLTLGSRLLSSERDSSKDDRRSLYRSRSRKFGISRHRPVPSLGHRPTEGWKVVGGGRGWHAINFAEAPRQGGRNTALREFRSI
ncbi:hypothetical protein KM043_011205 [Ampulex compressa]|nr:hypothetical protein KM043_011205 [Ampulex compressa]